MSEIQSQVAKARRRLNLDRFLLRLPFWIFVGLVVSAGAWAIPKLWVIGIASSDDLERRWQVSWLFGSAVVSLIAAIGWHWRRGLNDRTAAIEIDQRFRLKERISSALDVERAGTSDAASQCLVADAAERVARTDVRDQFGFGFRRNALAILIPAIAMVFLWFVPRAEITPVVEVTPANATKPDIKTAIEEAKKQIEEKKKDIEALGLKDMIGEMESLGKKMDEMDSGSGEMKKEALVKLNDLRDELESRKAELGSPEEMKKAFGQLNDLKSEAARELTDAMKKNDFGEAQKAMLRLSERIRQGKLDPEELKKLGRDFEEMAREIRKMARENEEQKQELQKKIEEARKEGDLQKAAELQEQLDRKKAMEPQIRKMQELADKLQKCANCTKPGDKKPGDNNQKPGEGKAGEKSMQQQMQEGLEELAEQMEQMEMDQETLETLEELEKSLQECKNAMNECKGTGDKPVWKDWARGEGPGGGKREKDEESETGEYKSRVAGQLQKGQTVVTGDAGGENIPGASLEIARKQVEASMSRESDPVEDQQLQRGQRQHAMEYFRNLRGGGN